MKCLFTEVMDYNYLLFLYFATIVAPALLLAAFYAHIYRVVLSQVQFIYQYEVYPKVSGLTAWSENCK